MAEHRCTDPAQVILGERQLERFRTDPEPQLGGRVVNQQQRAHLVVLQRTSPACNVETARSTSAAKSRALRAHTSSVRCTSR
ncbi:MAG: hypothetical protein ACT4NP_10050 [Pseudonocardiales bacterium]